MDFELDEEQSAIRATARELLEARGSGSDLWPELVELGWPGIAVGEEFGGQGLGLIELVVLVEELGYACAPTPMLGVALATLAIGRTGSGDQAARWLPGLAGGSLLGALGLDQPASLVPDAAADRLLVFADCGSARAMVIEEGGVEDVAAIDPRRSHGRVAAGPAEGEELGAGIEEAIDRAAVVVAAELVGICRRALAETIAYVTERRQFGVPVGAFQAVQHAAAQMLRDTEAAATATYHAAWTADFAPELLPMAAAQAKAQASDAGRTVTAAAIQLHGGIGFTWEAPLHWLFKRAQMDAVYLGGGGHHRTRLATLAVAALLGDEPQASSAH